MNDRRFSPSNASCSGSRAHQFWSMRAMIFLATYALPAIVHAQGTAADYMRADSLGRRFQNLVANVAERPGWIDANRFWYRKSVVGGNTFMLVDTRSKTKVAAFDHARLSTSLNALAGQKYTAITLPFSEISFDGTTAVRFAAVGSAYSCTLSDYVCVRTGAAPAATFGGAAGRGGNPFFEAEEENPTEVPWVEDDGLEAEVFVQRANAARFLQQQPRAPQSDTNVVRSPDGSMEAYIWNYNIFVRPAMHSEGGRGAGGRGSAGGRGGAPGVAANANPLPGTQLSWNGSEGHPYVMGSAQQRSLRWSPDSKKIAAFRVTPGYQRMVRFVESSPSDQLQPKYQEQYYQKPGDEVTLREPALFDISTKQQINISNALFSNAYQLSGVQ